MLGLKLVADPLAAVHVDLAYFRICHYGLSRHASGHILLDRLIEDRVDVPVIGRSRGIVCCAHGSKTVDSGGCS